MKYTFIDHNRYKTKRYTLLANAQPKASYYCQSITPILTNTKTS